MRWQQLVADVGSEMLEDGRPAYTTVVVSVPRQNGKTTLILAWEVDRGLFYPAPQRIVYSAQNGKEARQKLLDDQWPMIEHSVLMPAFLQPMKSMGSEAIRLKNRSLISVMASDESSGHGKTIGLGVLDEAWKDGDNRREQALRPAMRTVRDAQLLVASTMGTDQSLYLNPLIEICRESVNDPNSRIGYFEWSAPPGSDIEDPRVWQACTPALIENDDRGTISLDTLHAEWAATKQNPSEFARYALNQRTSSDERVIPEAQWRDICSEFVVPDGRLVFALDCDPDRQSGAVARADQTGRVELTDRDSGTGWMIPTVTRHAQRWGAEVAVDPAGPAAFLIPELERAGVRIFKVPAGDFARACGLFYTAVADKKIQVRSDGRLDTACAAAHKRPSQDAWVWARRSSSTDISPLVAVTLAYWASQQNSGPSQFWSGDE